MSEQDPRNEQEEKSDAGNGNGWGRENLTELYEKMSRVFRENLERDGSFSEEAFERAMMLPQTSSGSRCT